MDFITGKNEKLNLKKLRTAECTRYKDGCVLGFEKIAVMHR